jgi:hypothetical protein
VIAMNTLTASNLKPKRGKLIHLIPDYRLPGIRAFSRWKEGNRNSLHDFEMSVSREHGAGIAKIATSSLTNPNKIPSVRVTLEEGEILHLPPKIAYLIKLAIERVGKRDRYAHLNELLANFEEQGTQILYLIAEFAMGDSRLHSVCAANNVYSIWNETMSFYSDKSLHYLNLENVPFYIGDNDQLTQAVEYLKSLQYQTSDYRKLLEKILITIFRRNGIKIKFNMPGKLRYCVDYLESRGRRYIRPDPYLESPPEMVIPLGVELKGELE